MMASKKTYFGTKVVSRLHSREMEQLLSKGDKNRSSFVQNMELQRSLTLVSPGGFLFRLNKLKDNTTKNRRQNGSAIVLQGKTISSDFKVSDNKRDLFVRNSERQDVATIIKQSILQRQTHSLAAGKWKSLFIEGKTTLELKTIENQRKGPKAEAYSRGFKEKVNLLPPVEKRKTKDELRLRELNLDFNKVLLRKPGVLNKNRTEGKFQREEYKTANNENNDNLKSIIPPPMTTAPDSHKKRTIIVFLPVVSADEQFYH